MKTDTILWLLPIVFMFHDLEEIIMIQPWLRKNAPVIQARFPFIADRILPHITKLSSSSFTLAVAEEFILLSGFVLIAVEAQLYSFWAGLLLGFFIHLLVHIGQFLALRAYVPVIITSFIGSVYCLYALYFLNAHGLLQWNHVFLWTIITLLIIIVNYIFSNLLAKSFESWLKEKYNR